MTAADVLDLIYNLPNLIKYIYPGYITIYTYKFCRGITVRNTKAELIQSVCLSYIYTVFICRPTVYNNVYIENFFLILVSVLFGYVLYLANRSEAFLDVLKAAEVKTHPAKNVIDYLKEDGGKGLWLIIYLKDESIVYEGWLAGHDLESGNERFLILSAYRKFLIVNDSKTFEYIEEYDSNKEKVVIYYDNIKRIEKRDAE